MTFPLGSSWPYKNQRKPCDVFANVTLFHENGQTHFDKNLILLYQGRKHYILTSGQSYSVVESGPKIVPSIGPQMQCVNFGFTLF